MVSAIFPCSENIRQLRYIYYTSVPLARSGTINNNIAIIQLKGNGLKGQLTDRLDYACLSPPYHHWPSMAMVTGWGNTVCGTWRPNYGGHANPLHYGNVNTSKWLQKKLQRTLPGQ
jgi:hypothetical protein